MIKVMGAIKGIGTVYRTGDFLYKQICRNRGISFKCKYMWNYFFAYKTQKKLIELARADKLKANSQYEMEKIERLKKRNFIFLFYRDKYTILQNNCLIITKEIEIKAIDNEDIILVNSFRPEFFELPKDFDLKKSKNNFRFTDFTFNCKVYDKNNNLIKYDEKYMIDSDNTFRYQIKINNAKKDDVFKIFYSVSIPEEFKSKIIKTKYNTPIPYLEIVIQRDNYQGLLKLEDFRPSLRKYVSGEEYIDNDSSITNETMEDFYYVKSIWKIWYNNWVQKEIPMLVMEYKE